jgi:hypothetical protein
MKVVAFVMIMCLVLVSAIPGREKTIVVLTKENCCHKMIKHSPCRHEQKDDCGRGSCNTMLSCATCGFLKAERITVNPIIPVLKETLITPYLMGDLSDYSIPNWNPPKV